jgi:hypothetical protein
MINYTYVLIRTQFINQNANYWPFSVQVAFLPLLDFPTEDIFIKETDSARAQLITQMQSYLDWLELEYANLLPQQSAGRHVATLVHIILIPT